MYLHVFKLMLLHMLLVLLICVSRHGMADDVSPNTTVLLAAGISFSRSPESLQIISGYVRRDLPLARNPLVGTHKLVWLLEVCVLKQCPANLSRLARIFASIVGLFQTVGGLVYRSTSEFD